MPSSAPSTSSSKWGAPKWPPILLRAAWVRREQLDVARDGADVLLVDETLPRCHAGAGPPGLNDSNEVLLAALERQEIRGGRGALGVGAMTLRALRQDRRPRGAKLRGEGRRRRGSLGQGDPVACQDGWQRRGLQLLDRAVHGFLEVSIRFADDGADLEVATGIVELARDEAGVPRDEPARERRFHDHRVDLAPEERSERLVGSHVDPPVVAPLVDQLITERHRLDADDPGFEILERADAADTRGDHDLAHDIVRRGQAQPGLVVHEARGDGKAHDEVAPTLVELPEHDDLPRGGNPVDRQLRLERRRDGAGDLDLEARLPGVPTGERQVRRIRAQPEPPNLAGAARGRDQDDRDHEPPQYS